MSSTLGKAIVLLIEELAQEELPVLLDYLQKKLATQATTEPAPAAPADETTKP